MTSLALHVPPLAILLLVPAGVLHSPPPDEIEVVFHRPAPPQIEIPVPAPPRHEIAALPGPGLPDKPPGPKAPNKPPAPGGPKAPGAPGPASPAPDMVEPSGPLEPDTPGAVAEAEPEKKPGKAGLLAFKDQFASLAKDNAAPRLGADARFRGAVEGQASAPSMLATNSPGSSGGINLASLSRNLGSGGGSGAGGSGGGGGRVQRVSVASSIDSIGGGERPLANGPGPSRTDEEIQIVFDRYKALFYRLYNRELRNDPTLQGQMVLKLTIEADGSVSMCVLQSSDMNAPDLARQVVDVVKTINFGAKEGVHALTIAYPIDFLPAS